MVVWVVCVYMIIYFLERFSLSRTKFLFMFFKISKTAYDKYRGSLRMSTVSTLDVLEAWDELEEHEDEQEDLLDFLDLSFPPSCS